MQWTIERDVASPLLCCIDARSFLHPWKLVEADGMEQSLSQSAVRLERSQPVAQTTTERDAEPMGDGAAQHHKLGD